MRVGERAKVIALSRPTKEDRTARLDAEGLLVRRLNVPWDPEIGELWELRFDDRTVVVFSEAELVTLRRGEEVHNDMAGLAESWGKAPRVPSLPFRRFGSNASAAPAMLALLVFAIAGVLLVWAGVDSDNWMLGAAGALLVLIGIGAAGVLIN